jgi:diguanylate cyclase (GGDEF)-like protein/PAS domain S-box-containing protein
LPCDSPAPLSPSDKEDAMDNPVDSSSLLKEIYDSAIDFGIITLDNEGKVTTWSAGAEHILGFTTTEIIGRDCSVIFTPEDQADGVPRQEMATATDKGRAADYRWHIRKNGSRFWADGVMTPIRNEEDRQIGYLKIMRDSTERKIAQDQIQRLATSDALTGLANRESFYRRLSEMTALSARNRQLVILHIIDLDHFKYVNDSQGHHAGDLLLRYAAQRMRSVIRDSDFIARLGGDEFAIVQSNAPSAQAGGDLASKLLHELTQPFNIENHEVTISGSIGIAVCPEDARDPDQLFKKADLALYRSKGRGRACFHYFVDALDVAAHQRSRDIAELKQANKLKNFRLDYQPIVDCYSGQVQAFEALLRFESPHLSARGTEYVVNLGVEIGLMSEIGLWVMRKACQQLRAWRDIGYPDLKMSVNLCAQEITHPEVVGAIDKILSATKVEPGDLKLEVTERDLISAGKDGYDMLEKLRERGFPLALDDFGTGFSSLSYLQNMPITGLKLDRSFLHDVPYDARSCAITRTILSLARTLDLSVVAEGVEEADQAEFLRGGDGCTSLQGFLFSKPLSADKATAWLKTH